MCGITAILSTSKIGSKHNKAICDFAAQAMQVGSLRGDDNTGIMYMEKGGKVKVLKKALDGYTFRSITKVDKALNWIESYSFAVIHNRSATKGGKDDEHSHPFQVGDITLVHNGTINNHHSLAQGYDVDSEAICAALADTQPKAACTEVLEKLRGAFVLMWHDKRDNSFNLAKNEDRPLAVAYVKDENTMLACSEADMLKWLADRNKLPIEEIYSPKNYVHYKWDLDNKNVKEFTATEFAKPTYVSNTWGNMGVYNGTSVTLNSMGMNYGDVVEFDLYTFEQYSGNSTAGIVYGIPTKDMCFEVKAFNVQQELAEKFDVFTGTVSHVISGSDPRWPTVVLSNLVGVPSKKQDASKPKEDALVAGPGGVLIPFHEWQDAVSDGCCTCSGALTNPSLTKWENNSPLCLDCHEQVYEAPKRERLRLPRSRAN